MGPVPLLGIDRIRPAKLDPETLKLYEADMEAAMRREQARWSAYVGGWRMSIQEDLEERLVAAGFRATHDDVKRATEGLLGRPVPGMYSKRQATCSCGEKSPDFTGGREWICSCGKRWLPGYVRLAVLSAKDQTEIKEPPDADEASLDPR